ncbi:MULTISPECIES: response regulator [unclassified Butyrivibrio]|uniref:response regulator n=1 Tax=unclassified Butyrivibrio TaxID=2639466 RepID=UPI000402DA79|nr:MULTISPECIES: response regulator [unclassified Butyrivibrio]
MSRVVLISNHFSVVVRSIEKSLTEQHFNVTLLEIDMEQIMAFMEKADIFLIYLQNTILDEEKKVKDLFKLCDAVRDHNRRLILIGADRDRDMFIQSVPAFHDCTWMGRPVDMEALTDEIKGEIERLADENAHYSILIIDDDPVYARMVREWLRFNYTVSTVEDGTQGITYISRRRVDLILLDYDMPVVDGPTILEMLKSFPATSQIPVMFLTGKGDRESIKRVVSLKPEGYILKTVTKQELLKTLNEFFEKVPKSFEITDGDAKA